MRALTGLWVLGLIMQHGATVEDVTVPAGGRLLRTAEGRGVQIYRCDAGGWVFQAPEADLFEGKERVGTHGAGPVWVWNDGSAVRGVVLQKVASMEAGAVPWLLLKGTPEGMAGVLAGVIWVRRWDTHGGSAPAGSCEAGKVMRVEYSAKYSFYRAG